MKQIQNYYSILIPMVVYTICIFINVDAEILSCKEAMSRDNVIQGKSAKELWKFAKNLREEYFETDKHDDVVRRYLKNLRNFKNFGIEILNPMDWCDQIKDLCIETLRMAGFYMEEYMQKQFVILGFEENGNKALAMKNENIPQTGFVGDYVRFKNSNDPKRLYMFTTAWCTLKCVENMTEQGFIVDSKMKSQIKKMSKTQIDRQTGCAKKVTTYYLSEPNSTKCTGCDKKEKPCTKNYWCRHECV